MKSSFFLSIFSKKSIFFVFYVLRKTYKASPDLANPGIDRTRSVLAPDRPPSPAEPWVSFANFTKTSKIDLFLRVFCIFLQKYVIIVCSQQPNKMTFGLPNGINTRGSLVAGIYQVTPRIPHALARTELVKRVKK